MPRRRPGISSSIRSIRFNRHGCELLKRIKMRAGMVNHLRGFADVKLRGEYCREAVYPSFEFSGATGDTRRQSFPIHLGESTPATVSAAPGRAVTP